jgi:error-prone DNA polymerase
MSATLPSYAELHCRSNFTFLQGASHPEELVQRACDLAYSSLAITDECSLAGVVRAHVEAKKHGLHLIIGSEITLDCGSKLVFLACNRNGYGNLSELITLGRRRAAKGFYTLYRNDLDQRARAQSSSAHLAFLPDCLAILIPQQDCTQEEIEEQAAWLARTFPARAWIAAELLHHCDDEYWLAQLHAIAQKNRCAAARSR